MADKTAEQLIAELQAQGYTVTKDRHQIAAEHKIELARWKGKALRFGVVSDTHLGSNWQQLTHLRTFYHLAKRRGVSVIFHSGDLVDGEKIYRGQEYGIHVHGADAQVKYAVEYYPKVAGITTKVIAGNHDLAFWKTAGVNVVQAVADKRSDIEYLGVDLAFVTWGGLRIALMHGRQGNAYARSYRSQKIVEQFPPEKKPNMLFIGHYHAPNHIPAYRNVEAVQMAGFQNSTDFAISMGINFFVAGLIVTVIPDDRGIASVTYEWIPFYVPIENDY